MKRRYQAIATMLAAFLLAASGCVTSSAQRRTVGATQVASHSARPKAKPGVDPASTAPSSGGILSEVEAPKIASAVKFEEAPSATESPQVRSMREQMTRRYGCCGK